MDRLNQWKSPSISYDSDSMPITVLYAMDVIGLLTVWVNTTSAVSVGRVFLKNFPPRGSVEVRTRLVGQTGTGLMTQPRGFRTHDPASWAG